MRRAQLSIEFLFVMGFAALVLAAFLFVILLSQQDAIADETQAAAQRIASEVRQELITAAAVRDGYERVFELPESVRAREVSFEARPEALIVSVGTQQAYIRTPAYQGAPQTGVNVLTKHDGVIAFT